MDRLEQTKIAITLMAAAQIMHYALDEVQDAPWYRHQFKAACKNLEREVTKVCDNHIANLWDLDEEIIRQIQDGIEEITKELAVMDPVRIMEFGILLKDGKINYIKDEESESQSQQQAGDNPVRSD